MSSSSEKVAVGPDVSTSGHVHAIEWPIHVKEGPADPRPPRGDGEPHIGSSLTPSILGVDLYGKTPADAYDTLYKLNPVMDTPAMFFGRIMENPVLYLTQWSEDMVVNTNVAFVRHPFHPFMGGHADGIIEWPDGNGIAEVKCMSMPQRFNEIRLHGPPEAHIVQVVHLCLCYGLTWGKLIYYSPQMGMMFYDVTSDVVTGFQKYIIDTLRTFWTEHYEAQVRPTAAPPLPTEPLPEISGIVATRDDDEFQIAADDWLQARAHASTARHWETKAKSHMKEVLGEFGVYEGAGVRVYFQKTKGRTTTDVKAVLKHKPVDAIKLATELLNDGMSLMRIEGIISRSRMDLEPFQKLGEGGERIQSYPISDQ